MLRRVKAAEGQQSSTTMVRLVAELYYERGLSQQAIAEITGLSVATVSRLNRRAREEGIVEFTVHKHDPDLTGLGDRLADRFGIEVIVTPGQRSTPSAEARVVGAGAAAHVARRFPVSGTMGWASGTTMQALVAALPPVHCPETSFVPLIGGSDARQPHLDANVLVRDVAAVTSGNALTLHAPAVFDSLETKKAVLADSAVRAIVERWADVNTAVISSGGPPDVTANYFTVMDRADPTQRRRLAEDGVVGDALGHLFTIDGSFVHSEWSERTIAMPLDQLRQVPTVIAVLGGRNKVRSLVGLARTRLVDLIITDSLTARDALELL